jgi:aspartate aminotransferase-like enzyme
VLRGTHLCLDAISAIGAMPIDLRGVWLATSVSGKALGGLPGLAIVLHSHTIAAAPERLPRYLDLGLHHAADGVPFTQSSNLVAALSAALRRFATAEPFVTVERLARLLRQQLRALGLSIMVDDASCSPAVTTLALRAGGAASLGDALATRGFQVSYQSAYLRRANRLQICLMGEHSERGVLALVAAIRACLGGDPRAAASDRGAAAH